MKHIGYLPVQINWRVLREQSTYTHRNTYTHTHRGSQIISFVVSEEFTKTCVLKLNNDLMLSFAKA